jgi:hypothetical protein
MLGIMLLSATLEACTPSAQKTAMRSPNQDPRSTTQNLTAAIREGHGPAIPDPIDLDALRRVQAAQGPIPQPVSAAENLAPALPAVSPAEAQGRRTLSTAFVMVGPDGHLTVELRNGRVLVLRNALMRRKDYCGVQVLGGPAGVKYCGAYADIAAARPGGVPAAVGSDLAVRSPVEAHRGPAKRD